LYVKQLDSERLESWFLGRGHTILTSCELMSRVLSSRNVCDNRNVTTWPTCRVLLRCYQLVVCRKTYCLCQWLHWNQYDWNVISPDCLAPEAPWDNV